MKKANKIALSAALACTALGSASAYADVVYVTSTCSNATTRVCGDVNVDQNPNTGSYVYSDVFGGFTSAKASVTDKPVTPGSRYFLSGWSNSTPDIGITLNPALGVPGGVYKVFHVFSSTAGNVSTTVLVGATNNENCALSFDQTDKFQASFGTAPQKWQFLGFLTNAPETANPKLTLFHKGGVVDGAGTGNRLVVDTFKFQYYEPCTDVEPVSVTTGPLTPSTTSVVVSGVASNAAAVTVYQDSGSGFQAVGTKTSELAAGNNTVTVSGLQKGGIVAATQTIGAQPGCMPATGVIVGGGPNPKIRVALSVREAVNATGPVGADGRLYTTNSARIHYIGATSIMPGQGPADGKVVTPANEWQTVTFQRGPDYLNPVDPTVIWNSNITGQGGTMNDLQGDWATLESIAFAIEDTTDTGSFKIYIDNVMAGATVLEDFESAPAGMSDYTFHPPRSSGTTQGYLLAGVNDGVIDNTVSDTGAKSLRLAWQFNSTNSIGWVRLNTFNSTQGKPNPMFNLADPVSFRILLQPVGAAPLTNTPVAPVLALSQPDGKLVLNWSGAHRLQTTAALPGGWTNVPQVIVAPNTNTFLGPWTNTYTDPARFFRLVD